MAATAASELPQEAYEGLDFNFAASDARAEASALNVADVEGRIWGARLSNRGDRISGRDWVTDLFVEQRHGSAVRFGAQLVCKCRGNDPGFDHSRPRVIRNILDELAAEADDEGLTNEFRSVDLADVESLVSLLYNPRRRLPVLVVSVDEIGGAQVDLERLATRLSGTAHLKCVSTEPSFELIRTVGKRMSVFNGAVRIYMPGLDHETEDPFQHPLWISPASGWSPKAANQIATRILPMGFRDAEGDARFWRVGLLRQAQSRMIADKAVGSREEQLEAEIAALQQEANTLRESTEAAEALMNEEATKAASLQADIARVEEENFGLRQKIRNIGMRTNGTSIKLGEEEVEALFEQNPTLETSLRIVSTIFPDRVEILESAFESARDSYAFIHRKKAFSLLRSLCTDYWKSLQKGEGDVTARKCFGAAYAAKEASTLSAEGRKRRTFSHNGSELFMEKHLKVGVADNKTETLRVHFEWLGETSTIVVGHCGGHLDF